MLQVAGTKEWTTYGTPVELPLAAQDFDPSAHERGELTLEFELQPGDLAYIPRGVVHDARSGETVSLHITVGVLTYTWVDFLLEWFASAGLNDLAYRKSLPHGFARPEFDRKQIGETLQSLLQRLSTESNCEAVLDRFVDHFVSACPPILTGQMAQLSSLDDLTIQQHRRGESRHHLSSAGRRDLNTHRHLWTEDHFPAHAREALHFALSHSEFAIHRLPGDWDDASKLILVRRLIREGLLFALAPGNSTSP